MIPSAVPLNVRDISANSAIGSSGDSADKNTIIGLLKRIVALLG